MRVCAGKRQQFEELLQELFLDTASAETGEYEIELNKVGKTGEHSELLHFMYGAGRDGKYTVMLELFNTPAQRELVLSVLPRKSVSIYEIDEALEELVCESRYNLTSNIYSEETTKMLRESFNKVNSYLWNN